MLLSCQSTKAFSLENFPLYGISRISMCIYYHLSPSLPPHSSLSLQGIGDSGQGFANAILFVLFTPKVRRYFLRKIFFCRSSKNRSSINNRGKSKVFYGAVQSGDSDYSKTELSDDEETPDAFSRDNEVNPHSVLLNHNT